MGCLLYGSRLDVRTLARVGTCADIRSAQDEDRRRCDQGAKLDSSTAEPCRGLKARTRRSNPKQMPAALMMNIVSCWLAYTCNIYVWYPPMRLHFLIFGF